jgi:hypothetical protein
MRSGTHFPIVLVKKEDGTTRVCIDFRDVNKQMQTDGHPLLLKEDILMRLRGHKIFSQIDLHGAYHQIIWTQITKLKWLPNVASAH